MEITRRLLLQALGAAGVVGGGGFAANEVLKQGSWLYDPSARTEAHNLFFMTADISSFLENLPPEYRQQVTGGNGGSAGGVSGSPVDPTKVDRVALVNGASFVGDTGLPTGMTTVAMSGSFRTAPFRGLASGAPGVESAGEHGGYDVYVAETNANPLQAAGVDAAGGSDTSGGTTGGGDTSGGDTGGGTTGSGGGSDGTAAGSQSVSIEETAIGVKQEGGGLVGGTTLATDDIPATAAVEQAIDAKQGNAPLLRGMNKYTKEYARQFGDQTLFMGAVWDPAFITLLVAGTSLLLENLAGPGAAVSELFQRLYEDARGAGAGVNVDGETTTTRVLLTYVTRDAARQTGLVQLLDAGFGVVERGEGFGPGIRDVDADYRGRSIVLRVEADTRAALSGGAAGSGGTGSVGDGPFGGSTTDGT
ncbi:MAG: hypothetical protein V5A13_10575 [Haloarculaceae archaeon]